jgi:hypothetical protein
LVRHPFVVAAAVVDDLVFVQQPNGVASGISISPAITVAIENQSDEVVTSDDSEVTLSIASGGPSSVLNGATPAVAVNGVATFSNVSINTAGTYTLQATDTADGLLATSASFTVDTASGDAYPDILGIFKGTDIVTAGPDKPDKSTIVFDVTSESQTTGDFSGTGSTSGGNHHQGNTLQFTGVITTGGAVSMNIIATDFTAVFTGAFTATNSKLIGTATDSLGDLSTLNLTLYPPATQLVFAKQPGRACPKIGAMA